MLFCDTCRDFNTVISHFYIFSHKIFVLRCSTAHIFPSLHRVNTMQTTTTEKIAQCVVDHRYSVEAGWCGRQHDSAVMQESNVFDHAEHGLLFPRDTAAMNGTAVPVHLIGDTAYPLTSWLLKPYTQSTAVGGDKRHFNTGVTVCACIRFACVIRSG